KIIAPGVEHVKHARQRFIGIMKILPVRKRLAKPLAGVATSAGRRGNYRFRPADVFVSLFLPSRIFIINDNFAKSILSLRKCKGAVPKVMSVALIEPLVEMTATLNVVVSINSTTVMQTYWTASKYKKFE
ncbi:MAG: hypothetical protein SOT45_00850, partial [Treponema sp.]|nr:hypothetical protein [Treponema sp.]